MTITLTRSKPKTKSATANFVIAVHGPPGSTGKSSIALNLAYEFAELGKTALLIDLDTHSPSMAQLMGITEPSVALAGCARLIRQSRFDREHLNRLSVNIKHRRANFRLLAGLSSPRRWGEISQETVTQLLNLARYEFELVILDLASDIEDNLTSNTQPISRNSATRAALKASDFAITIVNRSTLSLSRYLNDFSELQEIQPNRLLLLNRSESNQKIATTLKALTKESIFATIPDDPTSFELAESEHLPLALARRKSPARNAIAAIAHKLLECPPSAS